MMTLSMLWVVGCAGEDPDDRGAPSTPEPPDTDVPTTHDTNVEPEPEPEPSPIVLQGQLIELSMPADPWIAERLAGTAFAPPGALLTLYVSRATTPDELEAGLLPGLDPHLWTSDNYDWWFDPSDDGRYDVVPELRYVFHYDEHTSSDVLTGVVDGWEGKARLYLPTYALVGVPEEIALGVGLTLDIADQGFGSGVAVVVDADGAMTWTNDPADISGMYSANASHVTSVEIPASAFPVAGAFVVGFAAATRTFASDLRDLHPELSAVRAGRMAFWRVDVVAE